MSVLIFDNAIAWAQFRLKGGFKSILLTAICYGVLIGLALALMYETGQSIGQRVQMLEMGRILLLMAQFIMMIALGSGSVSAAIRRDITSRQIESHRLMPLRPIPAILGYLAGGPGRTIGLCTVNFIAGIIVIQIQQQSPRSWVVINALLLAFSIMLWSAMALAAFISRAIFWIIGVICFMLLVSGGALYLPVPGLLALNGAVHQILMKQGTVSLTILDTALVIALASQFLVSLLCILGAARKYERDDMAGLPLWFSIAALLLWIALSIYGINHMNDLHWPQSFYPRSDPTVTWIGTIIVSLVVALLVISSLARSDMARSQRQQAAGLSPRVNVWAFLFCLALCTALIASLTQTAPEPLNRSWHFPLPAQMVARRATTQGRMAGNSPAYAPSPPIVALTAPVNVVNRTIVVGSAMRVVAGVSAIFLAQIYLLMRMLYPGARRPHLAIAGIVAVLWFVPFVADLIYYAVIDPGRNARIDHFGLMSAIGCIVEVYDESAQPRFVLGIAAQFLILIAFFLLYRLVEKRRHAQQLAVNASMPTMPELEPSGGG